MRRREREAKRDGGRVGDGKSERVGCVGAQRMSERGCKRETDKGERVARRGRETNGRENEFSLAVR